MHCLQQAPPQPLLSLGIRPDCKRPAVSKWKRFVAVQCMKCLYRSCNAKCLHGLVLCGACTKPKPCARAMKPHQPMLDSLYTTATKCLVSSCQRCCRTLCLRDLPLEGTSQKACINPTAREEAKAVCAVLSRTRLVHLHGYGHSTHVHTVTCFLACLLRTCACLCVRGLALHACRSASMCIHV